MVEVKEVINEPTEADLKHIFTEVFAQSKALQSVFTDVVEEYCFKNGIQPDRVELGVSPTVISLRLGDWFLFHETKEWTTKLDSPGN